VPAMVLLDRLLLLLLDLSYKRKMHVCLCAQGTWDVREGMRWSWCLRCVPISIFFSFLFIFSFLFFSSRQHVPQFPVVLAR
jgi:hypothetical protein